MMKRKNMLFAAFIAIVLPLWACTPEEDLVDKPAEENQFTTDVEDKLNYSVKGTVSCDGVPVPGVVVCDGLHFATTDFDGRYWLKSTAAEDIVWVSIPSGYEVSVEKGWEPKFWYNLDHKAISEGKVQQFDFELKKVDNDNFRLMVLTDIHIRGRHESIGEQVIDSIQFIRDVRPAIQQWCADHSGEKIYGLVLGDMVQDSYIARYGAGLPQYKSLLRGLGLTLFHIPGNHEYETGNFGEVQTDPEGRNIRGYYRKNLGPTYYSFNLGKVHFVMLDGTRMNGPSSSKYDDEISPRQLEWLQGDLLRAFDSRKALVPEKLVICCHQPFFDNTTKTGSVSGCITNRKDVMKIVSGCNIKEVTIFSGHTHLTDIVNNLSMNSVRIDQYTHSALCGAFWIQRYNWDDSPNGWAEYEFKGSEFTRRQRGFDPEYDAQAIFYKDDLGDTDGADTLYINVPAYEKDWSVKVQKGKEMAVELQPVQMNAPRYTKFYNENKNIYTGSHNIKPRKVWHFFTYVLPDPEADYTMVVTAPDGTRYTDEYIPNF